MAECIAFEANSPMRTNGLADHADNLISLHSKKWLSPLELNEYSRGQNPMHCLYAKGQ